MSTNHEPRPLSIDIDMTSGSFNACRNSAQTIVTVGVDQLGRPAFGAAINDAMNKAIVMGEKGIP
jgi:hypothetical protein